MDEEIGPREFKSAEEIEDLIHETIAPVGCLREITVTARRLPFPDKTGSNWTPRYEPLPATCPSSDREVFEAVLASAKRHFNLWDVH